MGKAALLSLYDNSQGTLEDNEIFANALTGVEIKEGSSPTLHRSRINRNGYEAVYVHAASNGTIEDNDLRDNGGLGAWYVSADSEPNLKRGRNEE